MTLAKRCQPGSFQSAWWVAICVSIVVSPVFAEPSPADPSRADQEIFNRVLKETARIRGLEFKQEVPLNRIAREDLHPLFEKELERVYSDNDFRGIEGSLELLGAIPEGLRVDRMLLAMIGEQVAGLYDPASKEMKVVGDLSLGVGLVQIILEHELTHALTDQHFDLQSLPIEDIHNDDRALAALALVEGDATLSMLEYGKDLGIQSIISTFVISLFMDQASFNSAPPFFQGWLIFPYIGGETFLLDAMKKYRVEDHRLVPKKGFHGFDWELVDYFYRNPPVSTEQILHPEKIGSRDDPPKEIDEDFLQPILENGWECTWENTLGEFLTRTLFEQTLRLTEARRAAEGWGGDRYFLLAKNGRKVLVWFTIWDTLEDKEEFADSCDKMRKRGVFPGNAVVHRVEDRPEALVVISRDLNSKEIEELIESL
ncbi:MAG: hypothetical protein KC978_11020 [Candidatus Omnitrophica bacterium]|nr:hypothetical protein [Candidatus Omnitrophota bacterium]